MEAQAIEKVGFTEIVIEERIGSGAYGTVFRAICNKLPCAAKKIHEALIQPQEGVTEIHHEHRAPFRRFESEFQLLQELRHSNIIQYLGMHVDPETKLPVLLMELLDTNLTKYFEKSLQPLSYHIQVNLSLDIMRALLFLHVNKIVHRDLSGANILLTENPLKAKVSDFGMAKFLNTDMTRLTHTSAPGTIAYMPPEAFGDEFKENGDIFSFAVILIQILTQKFPEPQGSRYADRILENEKIKVLVKESERRHNHISLIRDDHPLLPIALDCLKNDEMDRPLASDLCDRLILLTKTTLYTESQEAKENPSSIVEEKKSFEFSDYVFITDEEKLTQAQHENKAVKDILEAKLKVLDNLAERNDEMLKIKIKNEKFIEKKKIEIQKLLNNKTENEQIIKKLADEIEMQHQTINDQQNKCDSFEKKIDEQNTQITNQFETIAKLDQKIKSDQEQISHQLETITKHEEHINELSLQLEQQSAVISLQEVKIEELLSQIPAKKKKQSVDGISFFEKMKGMFTNAKDETNKLDEAKPELVDPESTNTPSNETASQNVDATATTTELDFLLPGIESLKQSDQMHKDSGLTKNIVDSWDTINEADITQVTQSDLQVSLDEQDREKSATERLATAGNNVIATLSDIHKMEMNKNRSPQQSIKGLNEHIPTGRKEHKASKISPSPKAPSTKPQKTKKKGSSSSKSTKKIKTSYVNPFEDPNPFGVPGGITTTSAMKSREQLAIERMEASSARSVRTLTETNRIGVATTEELAIQGEKLDGIERHLEEMNVDLTEEKHKIETVKSPFDWIQKKKNGRTRSVKYVPPPTKIQAEPPAVHKATEQLRRLPSLGSTVIDANAERMSQLLSDLTVQAKNQGEMLDRQNGQVDRIHNLTDLNHDALKTVNKRIRKQL